MSYHIHALYQQTHLDTYTLFPAIYIRFTFVHDDAPPGRYPITIAHQVCYVITIGAAAADGSSECIPQGMLCNNATVDSIITSSNGGPIDWSASTDDDDFGADTQCTEDSDCCSEDTTSCMQYVPT